MESARIGGIALVGLVALLLLKEAKPTWAPFVRIAVAVAAFGLLLSMASAVWETVEELSAVGGSVLDGEAGSILVRALGIAFLTEVTASICRDSGEGGLAGFVEMAGKLELLLLSFPLIRLVLDTVASLLGEI